MVPRSGTNGASMLQVVHGQGLLKAFSPEAPAMSTLSPRARPSSLLRSEHRQAAVLFPSGSCHCTAMPAKTLLPPFIHLLVCSQNNYGAPTVDQALSPGQRQHRPERALMRVGWGGGRCQPHLQGLSLGGRGCWRQNKAAQPNASCRDGSDSRWYVLISFHLYLTGLS